MPLFWSGNGKFPSLLSLLHAEIEGPDDVVQTLLAHVPDLRFAQEGAVGPRRTSWVEGFNSKNGANLDLVRN